jgi:hypothetical protein
VYSLLGRTEEAISCLEKVMEHGTLYKNWAAKDSDLDALRSDPRFQRCSADRKTCLLLSLLEQHSTSDVQLFHRGPRKRNRRARTAVA